jgi:hypothetical protein
MQERWAKTQVSEVKITKEWPQVEITEEVAADRGY